jgi:hypothetical protein
MRAMKGVNMSWSQPPHMLYTHAQIVAKAEEVQARVRARTIDRSQKSVDEAVRKLRDLLTCPERRDLAVFLIWAIKPSGEIQTGTGNRSLAEYLEFTCPTLFPNVLVLESKGLWRGWKAGGGQYGDLSWKPQSAPGLLIAQHQPNFTRWALKTVEDGGLEQVVRDFQLMPTQLDFLIDALQVDHRGKPDPVRDVSMADIEAQIERLHPSVGDARAHVWYIRELDDVLVYTTVNSFSHLSRYERDQLTGPWTKGHVLMLTHTGLLVSCPSQAKTQTLSGYIQVASNWGLRPLSLANATSTFGLKVSRLKVLKRL